MSSRPRADVPPLPPLARLGIEAGPLLVFFVANQVWEILTATALFMAATAISVSLSYRLERRLAVIPLIGAFFVLVMGGLTLALEDALFIKIKPTIVNLLFASILVTGLVLRRPFLKMLMGSMLELTDAGWRKLSWRWAFFFVFLAVLNEVIWRNFSTDFWAGFKLFGMLPISMVFALAQVPLILKHQVGRDTVSSEARG